MTYRSRRRRLCGTCVNNTKGEPDVLKQVRHTSTTCAVANCERDRRWGLYCVAHGERVRKYGDPLPDVPIRKKTGSIIKALPRGTYRFIWKPGHPLAHADGYVAEHRLIAFDAGRLRDTSHQVHHINHDTLDNRLENLAVVSPLEHRRIHAIEDGVVNQFGQYPHLSEACQLCGRPCKSRDLCAAHYTRLCRYGDPLLVHRVGAFTVAPYRLYDDAGLSPWALTS